MSTVISFISLLFCYRSTMHQILSREDQKSPAEQLSLLSPFFRQKRMTTIPAASSQTPGDNSRAGGGNVAGVRVSTAPTCFQSRLAGAPKGGAAGTESRNPSHISSFETGAWVSSVPTGSTAGVISQPVPCPHPRLLFSSPTWKPDGNGQKNKDTETPRKTASKRRALPPARQARGTDGGCSLGCL